MDEIKYRTYHDRNRQYDKIIVVDKTWTRQSEPKRHWFFYVSVITTWLLLPWVICGLMVWL